uniref:Uncharacterized protein n=1 Tax=Panagrolaimus sp. PS1159 TaxID=55785 RepID=A0AC35ETN4_9BILA
MSTKDHCLLSNNNTGKIGKTALTWNDQYNNINLNQNQKCEDLKIVHSESKPFYSSQNNNNSLNCNQYDSTERKFTFSRKKNDTLKSFGDFYFAQKEEERYESQNKNNEISSEINSTLSLHIEAYENSAEAQNVNADDFMMKKSKQDAFNKLLMNVKSTVAIQDTFEFLRQQTEEPMKPEVMQFKATQKLRNPSFLNEGENKAAFNICRKLNTKLRLTICQKNRNQFIANFIDPSMGMSTLSGL